MPLPFVISLSDSKLIVFLITLKPLDRVWLVMYFIQILASMIGWKKNFFSISNVWYFKHFPGPVSTHPWRGELRTNVDLKGSNLQKIILIFLLMKMTLKQINSIELQTETTNNIVNLRVFLKLEMAVKDLKLNFSHNSKTSKFWLQYLET